MERGLTQSVSALSPCPHCPNSLEPQVMTSSGVMAMVCSAPHEIALRGSQGKDAHMRCEGTGSVVWGDGELAGRSTHSCSSRSSPQTCSKRTGRNRRSLAGVDDAAGPPGSSLPRCRTHLTFHPTSSSMRLGTSLPSPGPAGEPSWPLSFSPQVYTSPCPVTPAAWLLPMLMAAQRRATCSDCGSATSAVLPTPSCPSLLEPAVVAVRRDLHKTRATAARVARQTGTPPPPHTLGCPPVAQLPGRHARLLTANPAILIECGGHKRTVRADV